MTDRPSTPGPDRERHRPGDFERQLRTWLRSSAEATTASVTADFCGVRQRAGRRDRRRIAILSAAAVMAAGGVGFMVAALL